MSNQPSGDIPKHTPQPGEVDLGPIEVENIAERTHTPEEILTLNKAAADAIYGVSAEDSPTGEPIEGEVQRIQRELQHESPDEIKEAVESYKEDVRHLVDIDGFYLAQAKLIMDLRKEHNHRQNEEFRQLIASAGDVPSDVRDSFGKTIAQQAKVRGESDDFTRAVVRARGLMTREEYNAFRYNEGDPAKGESQDFSQLRHKVYPASDPTVNEPSTPGEPAAATEGTVIPDANSPSPEAPPADDPTLAPIDPARMVRIIDSIGKNLAPEDQAERGRLLKQLDRSRDAYAQVIAARGSRSLHLRRSHSKKALQQAKDEYTQLRNEVVVQEASLLRVAMKDDGIEDRQLEPQLNQASTILAISEAQELARLTKVHRLVATGIYRVETNAQGVSNFAKIPTKTSIGALTRSFYEWWGNHSDAKLLSTTTVKKALAIGVPAAIVAAPTAALLGAALGSVGAAGIGAYLGTRYVKAHLQTHIAKRSDTTHADKLDTEIQNAINRTTPGLDIAGLIREQTERQVRSNRRRVAAIGATALGGYVAGEAVSHVADDAVRLADKGVSHVIRSLFGGDQRVIQSAPAPQPPHASEVIPEPENTAGGQAPFLPTMNDQAPTVTTASYHPATDHAGRAHARASAHGESASARDGHQGRSHANNRHTARAAAHHDHDFDRRHEARGHKPNASLEVSGDTISDDIADRLRAEGKLSEENLNEATRRVLKANHISYEQARHLPVGFKYQIPPQVIEEMVKVGEVDKDLR